MSTYIDRINALIPHAEGEANRNIHQSDYKTNDAYAFAWNRAYHGAMDRMAAEAGLRAPKKGVSSHHLAA